MVVSIALIVVSVIVWWRFDRWGRICLGFSLGVILGWIVVTGIIHIFLRKAYIDAFIYIIPGLITAFFTLNKRRYMWILECVSFAGYIFVHSVGGWITGFEEINPFLAPKKMNYVQFAYIGVAILIAVGGFIFQWKRTVPDKNEGQDDIGWSKKRLLSEHDIEKGLTKNEDGDEKKKAGVRFGWFGGGAKTEEKKAGSEFGMTQSSVTKPTKASGNEFGSTQSGLKKSNKSDGSEFGSTRPKKVDDFGFGSGNKDFHGKSKTSADQFGR